MNFINENNLRRIDLNNLLLFVALMRERSVTLAAKRLFLGQPAVSLGLKRLRELFKDELFVRTKEGMTPTKRAITLYEDLYPGLAAIEHAIFSESAFNPAEAKLSLTLGLPDDLEPALVPTLLNRIAFEAPGVQLILKQADALSTPTQLDDDEIDIALTVLPPTLKVWHRHEIVAQERFLCVYSPERFGSQGALSLEQYLSVPHVLVSATGQKRGLVDLRLEELGYARRIALVAARFSSLPHVLRQCHAIANVPSAVARMYVEEFGLATCPLPFESPRFPVALIWHARNDNTPAAQWLLGLLRTVRAGTAGLQTSPISSSSE